MSEDPKPFVLKHWFDEARYRKIASDTRRIQPAFDHKRFLQLTLDGLESRELMARMRQTANALHASLPGSYREQLTTLRELAPQVDHEFVSLFLCDFVEQFGLHDFDHSMEALQYFTTFGSAEFAIRPFILADQPRALKTMHRWTKSKDEKVRRLASEGSRPRLPWGKRLHALVQDPSPTAPILDALKQDPALFVRKSVANHLNDITKDHPDWVLDRLHQWEIQHPHTAWIAKHACRTLIKKGHARTMALFGFGNAAAAKATLVVSPETIQLGDSIQIQATILSTSRQPQRLAIDYVIHYIKANGSPTAKVFKWTETNLAAGDTLQLRKNQTIKDFSTRKHFAGKHRVELQINGARVAESHFTLSTS